MGLNADQLAVIQDPEGARVVVAGPGSGKTTTMIALIESLIQKHRVPPSEIRAITFSKEMAGVLARRLGSNSCPVSTFHSLGYAICSSLGAPKPVEIHIRYRLLCALCKKYQVQYKELEEFISRMRRARIKPSDILDNSGYPYSLCCAYALYEQERHEGGWIDFDSMISDAVDLLEKNEGVRAHWQSRYLIVDEAQDTDSCAWRMLQLLSEKYGNITVVGDPGQCQPDGTQVLVVSKQGTGSVPATHIWKSIENIIVGDRVVPWNHIGQLTQPNGKKVTAVKSRVYIGDLITIQTGEGSTRCTPNHYCWVRFNLTFKNKYLVYLMYRSDLGFRVGITKASRKIKGLFDTYGLSVRTRQEKAERAWILAVCRSRAEAETQEEIISLTDRIPESVFEAAPCVNKTSAQIKQIYTSIGPKEGYDCLESRGLLFDDPLYTPGTGASWRGYFKTAAANLISEVMDIPTPGRNVFSPIEVSRSFYSGLVHSLDVENLHTYVADGVVVGNSIYMFRGAEPANITNFQKWFPTGRRFYLGRNYRSTHKIVDFVRKNTPSGTPHDLVKRMVPARPDQGADVALKMYLDEEDEAESALALTERDPLNSVILARTNHLVGVLERICAKHNIKYRLLGKTGFWKQTEISQALTALRDVSKEVYGISTTQALDSIMPQLEKKYAVDNRTDRDNDALDNLNVFREIGKEFPTAGLFFTYGNKMVHRKNAVRGVTISTVHQSKGGEWKNVYLIGATCKNFPHAQGDPVEEERIYYVAISRAIDYLRISFAGTPSRYLDKFLTDERRAELYNRAHEKTKLVTSLFGDSR